MNRNGDWGLSVDERGVADFVAVLKGEHPEILKELRTELRGIGADLASRASGLFFGKPAYGVTFRTTQRNTSLMVRALGGGGRSGRNDWSAPGTLAAILESFGAKSTTTDRSAACLATLNARYGTPGRFLNAAWKEGKSGYRSRAQAAVSRAERELQMTLDKIGV